MFPLTHSNLLGTLLSGEGGERTPESIETQKSIAILQDDPKDISWGELDKKSQQMRLLRGKELGSEHLHRRRDHLICSLADCST